MEINKQLFEDVLSGKLKGTFVLRDGNKVSHKTLQRTNDDFYPYAVSEGDILGFYSYFSNSNKFSTDIIDFIPETNMKENELTIEIPDNKVVDWDESKKQNKIILKDKQLTYEDVCIALYKDKIVHYIDSGGNISKIPFSELWGDHQCDSNNATTAHQLECILAKNMLANVAKYLNDENKSFDYIIFGYFICVCGKELEIHERSSYKFNNNIVFKTKELAQQAIEILGENTIKLALEPLGI